MVSKSNFSILNCVKIQLMGKKPVTFLNTSLSFHPWYFFVIFLVSNTALSYFLLPLTIQLFAVFLGLILPFITALKIIFDGKKSNLVLNESDNSFNPPKWALISLILLVIFTRFYRLSSMPFWPISDEGFEGALGIGLMQHWNWQILLCPAPHEPLIDWLLGVYFKLFEPSLFSFRLFSALVSLATIFAAYWGALPFLSRRIAFLFALILASSYWSLTLSRLGIVVILIPLFQCLSFGCLGRLLKTKKPSARRWPFAGLVASNILGFYSWTDWVGVALSLIFILIIYGWKKRSLPNVYLWGFLVISTIGLFPLIMARLAPGGMAHIRGVQSFDLIDPFFKNIIGILWNGASSFPYGSLCGGFLNPILDSLSILGILFLFERSHDSWRWMLPIVATLSFLPALPENNIELYRTLPVLVIFTLSSAAGIQSLLRGSTKKINLLMVILILTTSFGIDIFNYVFRYCDIRFSPIKQQWRTSAYAHAYEVLNDLQKKSGPLYIFSDFSTDYDNRTLDIALYPFNILQNPKLSQAPPQWVAVMTNVNYAPYLFKTYPKTQMFLLKEKDDPSDSPDVIALFIIPEISIPAKTLNQWKEADQLYRKINFNILMKNPLTTWCDIANSLSFLFKNTKEDKFLKSICWEKTAFFNFIGGDFKDASQNYRVALSEGYPADHLYYNLEVSMRFMKKIKPEISKKP